MLKYVRDTGIIRRICLESDREDIVRVFSTNMKVFSLRTIVQKLKGAQFQLRHSLNALQRKIMELESWLEIGQR